MERLEHLERVAWNELKKMNTAYAGKEEFTAQDCEKFDKIAHGLKCLLTATAMIEAEEYGMENRMSGRRNPRTGRYMDMGPQVRTALGYEPNQDWSGYYPDYPPHRGW